MNIKPKSVIAGFGNKPSTARYRLVSVRKTLYQDTRRDGQNGIEQFPAVFPPVSSAICVSFSPTVLQYLEMTNSPQKSNKDRICKSNLRLVSQINKTISGNKNSTKRKARLFPPKLVVLSVLDGFRSLLFTPDISSFSQIYIKAALSPKIHLRQV